MSTNATPAVWLSLEAVIQCVSCGQIVKVEAQNPRPDDLESSPELVVECPTCSQVTGCYLIPVVLLVGDQVADVLEGVEGDPLDPDRLDPDGEKDDDPDDGDGLPEDPTSRSGE